MLDRDFITLAIIFFLIILKVTFIMLGESHLVSGSLATPTFFVSSSSTFDLEEVCAVFV